MKIYCDKDQVEGCVITIGSFDGIHLGHQYLIKTAVSEAKRTDRKVGLVSFDPIPIQFFQPGFSFLLTTKKEKERILKKLNLDFIYYFTFNKQLAGMKPTGFLRLIKDHLNPVQIVTGVNHRFGESREGDVDMIVKNFRNVIVLDPITVDENVCSSTLIRESVVIGKVTTAWRFLGRPYHITGKIKKGTGLGREIGVPTINLAGIDKQKILPAEGVYLIRCHLGGRTYHGAMSIGEVTSIKSEHSIEAHLFNFHKEAYGKSTRIDFLVRLRDLKHFKGHDALKKQIKRDIELAKIILKNL